MAKNKKQSPKELREAAKAAKMAGVNKRDEERRKKAEEERIQIEKEKREKEENHKKEIILKQLKLDRETRLAEPKNDRKSLAKAAGLKSTFAVGNDLYMTSFGKGNDAIVEKVISKKKVTHVSGNTETFYVDEEKINDVIVPLSSKRISELTSQADNPLHRNGQADKVQPDKLLLKDTLEKIYFGKTFNDTLHIQIIYNILDIEKILTVHSVNTVYTLNNLLGVDDKDDFIGELTFQNTYDDFCKNNKKSEKFDRFYSLGTLGYFGSVFYKNNRKRSKKEVYDILCIIASIRQWCIHCEEDKRTWIYNAETVLDKEFIDILDEIYSIAIRKINNNFVKENKVNISILSNIYNFNKNENDENFKKLVSLYYRFIVKKDQKLLGFSIKKLREQMLEDTIYTGNPEKKDKTFDSVRSKLYKLIDFIIFYGYTQTEEGKDRSKFLVDQLRSSLSDESKENIYKKEADRLWSKYENIIDTGIRPNVSGSVIRELKNDDSLDNISIESIVDAETENITYFSKIMYLLAQFIDGKEVNDLTTTLINKFDNIRSFLEIADSDVLPLDCIFTLEYKLFDKSAVISGEMQIVKNLSGMSSFDENAKFQMYCDAMEILGVNENVTDEEKRRRINEILCIGADGKIIKDSRGKKKSGFRNFIASNVIESSRFRYLVKYCNPKKIRNIANNAVIIKFILGKIPDAQIERYYRSCNPELKTFAYPGKEKAIDELTDIIYRMKFEDFSNVKQNVNISDSGSDEAKTKQRYQATIGLYLTVCYLLVKNLVNINARYAMAFHFLERDARLYKVFEEEKDYDKLKEDYSVLTRKILADGPENAGNLHLRSKKWNILIRQDLKNYDSKAETNFRNAVAHLNPIRNADIFIGDIREIKSYYDIYHYIVQKSIIKRLSGKNGNNALNPTIEKYNDLINNYHTYCKDFVKALCVPFGYNVVRFKALSIYEMFDRNYKNELKEQEKKLVFSN